MPNLHSGRTPKAPMRLVCFLMAALMLAAATSACAPEKNLSRPTPLVAGEVAPDFSLVTVNGEVYRLEQFRGQQVIVYFWTTWCQTCAEEMAALAEHYRANKLRGPMVLAVNSEEEADVVAAFSDSTDIPFPLLVDIDGRVGDLFGMETIPTTYLIDANGVVQQVNAGTMSTEALDALMFVKVPIETKEAAADATKTAEPTASPTAMTIPRLKACVTAGVLNVRNGPSTTAPVVDGMGKGECADVDARSVDGTWLRFKEPIAGGRGWAAAKFLALDGPIEGLLIAE